ncbi:hypothetical protein Y032_0633g891 [Ancylostoma ceylanicum]|uniref:Uncharacterized protein n=1 Tax=Ancylostoma ceylanicum TaxID=53326 RepID=A0A016WLV6_9BILA|nr:hypothetical protein Y032_0633g891 [Ancylostoma ceylanicum]
MSSIRSDEAAYAFGDPEAAWPRLMLYDAESPNSQPRSLWNPDGVGSLGRRSRRMPRRDRAACACSLNSGSSCKNDALCDTDGHPFALFNSDGIHLSHLTREVQEARLADRNETYLP